MTVRMAELLMAIVLAAISVALMVKSAELNIGWVKGAGPGSGAWPFWLSAGMLATCIWTIVRWIRRVTPESISTDLYMTGNTAKLIGTTVAALTLLLIGAHTIGLYISLVAFLFFFLRIVGGHGWITTIVLMLGVPVIIFAFFEWALKIPIPKGISEPLFYPVYGLIY